MSSNPFRRSQAIRSPPDTPGDISIPPLQENIPTATSPQRKNSVRILSPSQSPVAVAPEYQEALIERVRRGSHEGSPPPVAQDAVESSQNLADPFDRELSDSEAEEEDDEVIENTKRNSEITSPPLSASGAPPNPFSKTLATIEDSRLSAQKEVTFEDRPTERTRASMDVDAFTRLLMTGSATPTATSTLPQSPRNHASVPSDSRIMSTEDTEVARDAIQATVDRSRASHVPESSPPAIDVLSEPRAAEEPQKIEKKPPPPPKHRHGKPVSNNRTPQTVSFSDFSSSISSPLNAENSPPLAEISSNEMHHKPLPPTPPAATSASASEIIDSPNSVAPASLPVRTPSNASQRSQSRKGPPPPPLARRQSQLRSTNAPTPRSRSNSNITISSQQSENGNGPQQKSAPPPPPPTRRSGAAPSVTSTSRAAPQQPGSGSHHAVPLPPPPRRESSKSSLDAVRPSAEVIAEARRASGESRRWSRGSVEHRPSSLRNEAGTLKPTEAALQDDAPATQGGDVDVLAEMEKFQQEIEALRQRQGPS